MITLLIRTSYRPRAYGAMMKSIDAPCRTIVTLDDARAGRYVYGLGANVAHRVEKTTTPYGYNLYCNILLGHLHEGHGLFLDDDDYLIPGRLALLNAALQPGTSYFIPFMRGPLQRPWKALFDNKIIKSGTNGLPCLVIWHEHKQFLNFTAAGNADHLAIEQLNKAVPLTWLPLPVVNSPARGWGKTE